MIYSHVAFVVTVVSFLQFSPSECRPSNEIETEPPKPTSSDADETETPKTTSSDAKESGEYTPVLVEAQIIHVYENGTVTESNASQTDSVLLDDEEEKKLTGANSTFVVIKTDGAGGDGKTADGSDVTTLLLTAVIATEIPSDQNVTANYDSVVTEHVTHSKSLTSEASNNEEQKKEDGTENTGDKPNEPLIFILTDGDTIKLEVNVQVEPMNEIATLETESVNVATITSNDGEVNKITDAFSSSKTNPNEEYKGKITEETSGVNPYIAKVETLSNTVVKSEDETDKNLD